MVCVCEIRIHALYFLDIYIKYNIKKECHSIEIEKRAADPQRVDRQAISTFYRTDFI